MTTPFVMEADDAATIVCNGFERAGFEIAFPWRLAMLSKFVRILPYGLRLPVIAHFVKRAQAAEMRVKDRRGRRWLPEQDSEPATDRLTVDCSTS